MLNSHSLFWPISVASISPDLKEATCLDFTDFNIVLALDERQCHFRCLDVSRCALNDRGLQVFLNHLEKQNATMECINIADNPGRIHLARFPITMSRFSQIRKLDLSRVTSTCGMEPLIAPEVMLSWRLEELIMTGVPVSTKDFGFVQSYWVWNRLCISSLFLCNCMPWWASGSTTI
jgi:hypothetical protein